ncbi:hypothetical protein MnTg04_01570 [bacterium MnTg04]|nr:hypothetical protein MnTg04_01570 [bacterium MnTg04]
MLFADVGIHRKQAEIDIGVAAGRRIGNLEQDGFGGLEIAEAEFEGADRRFRGREIRVQAEGFFQRRTGLVEMARLQVVQSQAITRNTRQRIQFQRLPEHLDSGLVVTRGVHQDAVPVQGLCIIRVQLLCFQVSGLG